uniref:Methionine--tRNA ligase n=1 Tax=Candidatus Aschnera chinzeii TaxID=1485666 RepID=A0AAT9G538_9ENTR|nr:MAG: methionine--tRNA ligase [Candidatus Aschnera chinzeii]
MYKISNTILVTCALPYANGPIHLGHLLEHIQADVWVRYHRMRGTNVIFICADDAHGTAIMLKSKELKISPEELINQVFEKHKQDLYDFNISYDEYHTTHSKENKILTEKIYFLLQKKGYIKKKIISQFYDNKYAIFLSDRFVKGKCPRCIANHQYGDNCEICGSTYLQTELIEPYSILSGTKPEIKNTEHLFFDLSSFTSMLKTWIHSGVLQKQIINKLYDWLNIGLHDWDITRDSPYFGFQIPNEINKYFYVWLDAPIGYMATFKKLCTQTRNINFDDIWNKNSTHKLIHFIGKDISYFHCLFWPAILEAIDYRKPSNIFVHGHLTINGSKMSKTRGTFITARTYLNHLDSDYLRYYFMTKLSSNINDIDFNMEDFMTRVNNDLINKIINLAARTAMFINTYFTDTLSSNLSNTDIYNIFILASKEIEEKFLQREYNKIIHQIISLVDIANSYINNQSPWILIKNKNNKDIVHAICTTGLNLFKILMTYLKPILPNLAKRVECFLNITLKWNEIHIPLLKHKINKFQILLKRVEQHQILSIKTASQKNITKINNNNTF